MPAKGEGAMGELNETTQSGLARRPFLLGLGASLWAMPAVARPPKFTSLFDGKTLDGWAAIGDANWRVAEGALVADKGMMGFLLSRESFRDFEIHAEFWVSDDANSGIFIRCSDRAQVTAANAYEVNIYDQRPDPSYGTGAIVDVAKVSPMPKAGGRWNVMDIIARGDRFDVVLNGRKTVDGARDAKHAGGPIALQYGMGVVKFRKVDIRSL
jgi:hypothetical protein